jgi:hypothetical protein
MRQGGAGRVVLARLDPRGDFKWKLILNFK